MLTTVSNISFQSNNFRSEAINFCAIISDLPDLKLPNFALLSDCRSEPIIIKNLNRYYGNLFFLTVSALATSD